MNMKVDDIFIRTWYSVDVIMWNIDIGSRIALATICNTAWQRIIMKRLEKSNNRESQKKEQNYTKNQFCNTITGIN